MLSQQGRLLVTLQETFPPEKHLQSFISGRSFHQVTEVAGKLFGVVSTVDGGEAVKHPSFAKGLGSFAGDVGARPSRFSAVLLSDSAEVFTSRANLASGAAVDGAPRGSTTATASLDMTADCAASVVASSNASSDKTTNSTGSVPRTGKVSSDTTLDTAMSVPRTGKVSSDITTYTTASSAPSGKVSSDTTVDTAMSVPRTGKVSSDTTVDTALSADHANSFHFVASAKASVDSSSNTASVWAGSVTSSNVTTSPDSLIASLNSESTVQAGETSGAFSFAARANYANNVSTESHTITASIGAMSTDTLAHLNTGATPECAGKVPITDKADVESVLVKRGRIH
ncbi:hypothetical protein RRG08_043984 [Elysia crispata]|uniref:Uncharacterized protein n=1 Tax=Elysia crispata TaxID=231223 RepID=A0AAE0ZHT0_9GAST|nr:hypothetical protein RRG08_043984 [Elysia crispata]